MSRTRGQLRGAINVGYRLRPRVDVAGLVSDDEAFVRVGAAVRFDHIGELWWSTSIASPLADREKNVMAIEMLLGGTRRVTSLVNVFVAGGVGLDNGFGVPEWRALAGVRFDREPRRPRRSAPARDDASTGPGRRHRAASSAATAEDDGRGHEPPRRGKRFPVRRSPSTRRLVRSR